MDNKKCLEQLKKLNSMMEDFLDMMDMEEAESDRKPANEKRAQEKGAQA